MAISMYPVKKKVHLSRNVQITTHNSIFGMISLGLNHGIHPSEHGFVKGMEVLWHDLVPNLYFQTFTISDLNKLTS